MESLKIFNYNEVGISFKKTSDSVMINLTEVAKSFPTKNLSEIVRSKAIQEYVDCLVKRDVERGISTSADNQYIKVIRGGVPNEQGTWAHQKVALRVAQHLSPDFAIWVDERLEELLQVGMTALPETLEAMILNPDLVIGLATQVKELRAQNEEKSKQLEEQKPLVEFANKVGSSSDVILIRELAKLAADEDIKIGEKRLYQWLRNNRFLMKNNEPYQQYIDKGLFKVVESTYTTPYGDKIARTTKVTGKGQIYFIEKLKDDLQH